MPSMCIQRLSRLVRTGWLVWRTSFQQDDGASELGPGGLSPFPTRAFAESVWVMAGRMAGKDRVPAITSEGNHAR
jgi:hypothetical protein